MRVSPTWPKCSSLSRKMQIESVVAIRQPFKLVGRELKQKKTTIPVGNVVFGSDQFVVIAGPCSVESREQILETARAVHSAGAAVLRGGAYKPRTSPYDFQGLEEDGLRLLAEARCAGIKGHGSCR